ncbi:purine-nucleoside phosphorylase [Tepidimonas taiwanensis]|uniref:Purine nucleoside phosphorylase n=1 Tax=Tepidimonas taiwanensis TaxID=307486 RepID=A0A554X353_9BURK|nr:purine-nucleoside phosphorylase [Tepidimonas taiwanensis]MCX7693636.1 purine-nucleoside phosphorylase [Tepidimonas taiwanensis]MDM7462788.1 purine-nucleoside phosphorylase [Tepidimonas taiwanensis]TSE30272.1 Purine nucleoside phosphorylase 2 [Tepidimonas taiwanensis]UBQ04793.1 purine-nucleoside phosphorylase [Tepidimonas taiwanensis]
MNPQWLSDPELQSALHTLRHHLPTARPRVAMLLGSGWGGVTAHIEQPHRIPYAQLPGFPQPSVAGHAADVLVGRLGPHEVAVLTGRKHTYETGDPSAMKLPLRVLRAWGCEVLVQTNAAGSLRADLPPGSLMALSDHINLPQRSPLIGEAGNERFVSMVNAYDADLRTQARQLAQAAGHTLHEGVYVWFVGPQFETPAEIRLAQRLGGDAVGMSTVPETLIARHAGMRVLALSLITNMGAGLSDENLSHDHTLAQAQAASQRACEVLCHIVRHLLL